MTSSQSKLVLDELDDGLLTVVLNRPERRNALSSELCGQLVEVLQRAAAAGEVRAVLLKGAGGTFCVGGDVKAMAQADVTAGGIDDRIRQLRARMEASRLLHDMPKPTVAAIAGAAAGAGLALALACDLRIAGESAKITTAFGKVGLSGDFGGTYFLSRLLGGARARELYLTSPILAARQALEIGLVTRVVADDQVDTAGAELGHALARGPTAAFGHMKQNFALAEHAGLDECLDNEAWRHVACMATADHREAATAFVEKREPRFAGR
ncbi:MAG: enoyl-CoA hydratase [Deltaproteobacteria bacterium]|nr:MAG: enoyl-CoA hydratase [Deltaproteobacteria bacterium]TMQ13668.1 MAG: enoyl-CoA hydratase [Deltaproteobacteria bacterium]